MRRFLKRSLIKYEHDIKSFCIGGNVVTKYLRQKSQDSFWTLESNKIVWF